LSSQTFGGQSFFPKNYDKKVTKFFHEKNFSHKKSLEKFSQQIVSKNTPKLGHTNCFLKKKEEAL
jgi:hypothetical protein